MLSYHDKELEIFVVFQRLKLGKLLFFDHVEDLQGSYDRNIHSFLAFEAGDIGTISVEGEGEKRGKNHSGRHHIQVT